MGQIAAIGRAIRRQERSRPSGREFDAGRGGSRLGALSANSEGRRRASQNSAVAGSDSPRPLSLRVIAVPGIGSHGSDETGTSTVVATTGFADDFGGRSFGGCFCGAGLAAPSALLVANDALCENGSNLLQPLFRRQVGRGRFGHRDRLQRGDLSVMYAGDIRRVRSPWQKLLPIFSSTIKSNTTTSPVERTMSYEFDLEIQLQGVVDNYEQEREAYWTERLEEEEWSPIKQLRVDAAEIARLIRKRAFALANTGSASDLNQVFEAYRAREELEKLQARLRKFEALARTTIDEDVVEEFVRFLQTHVLSDRVQSDPLRLVWEQLCIDEAWDVAASVEDRVRRTLELERLVSDEWGSNPPPEPCQQFLALVSRCYIYDLIPECIVMCRSAMEAAFRELVPDTLCRTTLKRGTDGNYRLADRIAAAFGTKDSPLCGHPELYKAAQEVQVRGNNTVHYNPHATRDALGTIRSAVRVIDALAGLSAEGPKH